MTKKNKMATGYLNKGSPTYLSKIYKKWYLNLVYNILKYVSLFLKIYGLQIAENGNYEVSKKHYICQTKIEIL
jgi:hypothetical protein